MGTCIWFGINNNILQLKYVASKWIQYSWLLVIPILYRAWRIKFACLVNTCRIHLTRFKIGLWIPSSVGISPFIFIIYIYPSYQFHHNYARCLTFHLVYGRAKIDIEISTGEQYITMSFKQNIFLKTILDFTTTEVLPLTTQPVGLWLACVFLIWHYY